MAFHHPSGLPPGAPPQVPVNQPIMPHQPLQSSADRARAVALRALEEASHIDTEGVLHVRNLNFTKEPVGAAIYSHSFEAESGKKVYLKPAFFNEHGIHHQKAFPKAMWTEIEDLHKKHLANLPPLNKSDAFDLGFYQVGSDIYYEGYVTHPFKGREHFSFKVTTADANRVRLLARAYPPILSRRDPSPRVHGVSFRGSLHKFKAPCSSMSSPDSDFVLASIQDEFAKKVEKDFAGSSDGVIHRPRNELSHFTPRERQKIAHRPVTSGNTQVVPYSSKTKTWKESLYFFSYSPQPCRVFHNIKPNTGGYVDDLNDAKIEDFATDYPVHWAMNARMGTLEGKAAPEFSRNSEAVISVNYKSRVSSVLLQDGWLDTNGRICAAHDQTAMEAELFKDVMLQVEKYKALTREFASEGQQHPIQIHESLTEAGGPGNGGNLRDFNDVQELLTSYFVRSLAVAIVNSESSRPIELHLEHAAIEEGDPIPLDVQLVNQFSAWLIPLLNPAEGDLPHSVAEFIQGFIAQHLDDFSHCRALATFFAKNEDLSP